MEKFFSSLLEALHEFEAYHDSYTLHHENRTGELMSILAKEIGISSENCQLLKYLGSIHDIGKVALPAYLFNKPGRLSAFERQTIRSHSQIGYAIVKKINHPLSELAATIILTHHESYDGSGYPNGLKGDNIPLEGRICKICDVYDALRAYRPYRLIQHANPHHFSIQIMTDATPKGMAKCFDPTLLEIFKNIHDKYENTYHDIPVF